MPSFDIVSEVDLQEVRNAVDQANREAATRFDFKNTDSKIEMAPTRATLSSSTEDRHPRPLPGARGEAGPARDLAQGPRAQAHRGGLQGARPARRSLLKAGISQDHGKKLNKLIKDLGLKGVSSQVQGDQVRVTGKKRDDLQAVIQACKEADLGIPLQFNNFRD